MEASSNSDSESGSSSDISSDGVNSSDSDDLDEEDDDDDQSNDSDDSDSEKESRVKRTIKVYFRRLSSRTVPVGLLELGSHISGLMHTLFQHDMSVWFVFRKCYTFRFVPSTL